MSKNALNIEILGVKTEHIKIKRYKRPDVFKVYPKYKGALNSGFTIIISNIKIKKNVKIKFKDEVGGIYKIHTIEVRQLMNKERILNDHQLCEVEAKPLIYNNQNIASELVFDKVEQPLVSIIIPVCNKWKYTHSCLEAVLENTKNISYEVIILDDVSTDETVNIYNYVQNIKVIRNTKNKGFLLNCNEGSKYAEGKYILFLNNDTNVQKDWLKYLVELIESNESIGMVGSKLIYENGRLQEAGGIIWKDARGCNYGRLNNCEKSEYNYVKEVDYISGACIMIKKDLWNKIGGFDERYAPAYFEDADLAFEVRKYGYKVMYQPKSVVVHFEGISHGTNSSSGIKRYQNLNRKKFISKWNEVLKKEHFKRGEHILWARDRSANKKTILVIDRNVPQYDTNAGNRTTYQYLKLFVEMGLNVKFMPNDFYQREPYTLELQQLGIEVLYGQWYSTNHKEWIKENANKFDYVYLNRPNISIKYLDFIKKYANAKILYYGHDLHYVRMLKRYEIEKKEELLKKAEHYRRIESKLFKVADIILTGSKTEEQTIKNIVPYKKVMSIPAFYYESFKSNSSSFKSRKDIMFVGGFLHCPNVDAVKWFVKEIFPKVLEKIPSIKFYIVGSNPPKEILDLNSDNIIVKGFVSDKELANLYKQVKLVVIPLRYGAGIKGKTIEAMYNQVPIVTTDFGIEGLKGINKIIRSYNNVNDFAKQIVDIYFDNKKLEESSKSYTQYIEENFLKRNAIDKIKMALEIKK
ncbi:glycosyltransferase [Lutibacter sp. B2]|nr:glycosyltransferase [Lutibacter sp. B2]